MNRELQVEEQLLAMAVGETTREDAALQARVLQRVRAVGAVDRAARPLWLAAAAVLVGGAFVVVGVALATRAGSAVAANEPQDPTPPRKGEAPVVTGATLPARTDHTFAARSAGDCLSDVAKASGLPVAIGDLPKAIDLKCEKVTPRQALAAIAAAGGAHLQQFGPVLAAVPGAAPPERRITLRRAAMPIHSLLAVVAMEAQANLVVSGDVRGEVGLDVSGAGWRDVVAALATAVGAHVVGCGQVLAVVPGTEPKGPRVYFAFDKSEAARVAGTIGKITGEPVRAENPIVGTVTVRLQNVSAFDALRATAAVTGHEVYQRDGVLRWRLPPADRAVRPVEQASASIDLAQAFRLLAAPGVFTAEKEPAGSVSFFYFGVPSRQALAALAVVARGEVEFGDEGAVKFVR